jgi:hypothetical protein
MYRITLGTYVSYVVRAAPRARRSRVKIIWVAREIKNAIVAASNGAAVGADQYMMGDDYMAAPVLNIG